MLRRSGLLATCALALVVAEPAGAQVAADATRPDAPATTSQSVPPSGEPQPSQQLSPPQQATDAPASTAAAPPGGDIVVTAQRRSERLVDVPIAITAITPQRMAAAGITNSLDLAAVAPGLQFPTQAAFAQPVIRGIGSSVTGPGAEPAVALYVDGVYQPNQLANIFDFSSVEQVEVLKGPQGTLFGRNATGGAITVRTFDPSFKPSAKLALSYGNFNEVKLNAYASGTLVPDLLAANIAVYVRREDSFTYNVGTGHLLGDVDEVAVRPKLLLTPSGNTRIILTGNWTRTHDPRLEGFAPRDGNNTQNILHPTVPRPTRPYEIGMSEDPNVTNDNKSISLKTEAKYDIGTLSTITAYGDIKSRLDTDGDSSAYVVSWLNYRDREKTFSQEVNFSSRAFGPLSIIGGAFFYDDDASRDLLTQQTSKGPFIRRTIAGVKTDAYAIYSEATLNLSDKLHVIGGLRYSHEHKQANAVQTGTAPGTLSAAADFSGLTPRVAVRYELSPTSNVYASWSKGFKSGAFNAIALQATPVKQEDVSAWEVGYKLSNRVVKLNLSAFYYDYSNIQVQSSITTSVLVLQNAAAARIYGADADLSVKLSHDWSLDGGAAYTHGRYTRFPGSLIVIQGANGINTQTTGDVSGNPTIRTPEWTANGTLSWTHDVDLGRLSASATGSYNSGFYWQADKRIEEPAYFLLTANVGIATGDRHQYHFAIWGRNLTDKRYALYQAQSSIGDNIIYALPRTFGVSASVDF